MSHRIVCCRIDEAESKVNRLTEEGWIVVTETIRLIPGAHSQQKQDGSRISMGYFCAVLSKSPSFIPS